MSTAVLILAGAGGATALAAGFAAAVTTLGRVAEHVRGRRRVDRGQL